MPINYRPKVTPITKKKGGDAPLKLRDIVPDGRAVADVKSVDTRLIHILDHHKANPWRSWCGLLIPPDAKRLNGDEQPANDFDPVCLNEYDAGRPDACVDCRLAMMVHSHSRAAQIEPGTEILPPIPTEHGLARRFALATDGLQVWIYPTGNVTVLIVRNDKIESIGMHIFAADAAQIVAAIAKAAALA